MIAQSGIGTDLWFDIKRVFIGIELPFGGVGTSGHGRANGFEALYGSSCRKIVAAHHG